MVLMVVRIYFVLTYLPMYTCSRVLCKGMSIIVPQFFRLRIENLLVSFLMHPLLVEKEEEVRMCGERACGREEARETPRKPMS